MIKKPTRVNKHKNADKKPVNAKKLVNAKKPVVAKKLVNAKKPVVANRKKVKGGTNKIYYDIIIYMINNINDFITQKEEEHLLYIQEDASRPAKP